MTQIPLEQQAICDRHRHPHGIWVEFTLADIEQSVAARFEQQVATDPARLAVQSETLTLSYGQLNGLANRIAHAILARRAALSAQATVPQATVPQATVPQATVPQAIAILLDNDAFMLAAILGVLKSGAPYVPFDPEFPDERLAYYWADADATLLLTTIAHYDRALALTGDANQVLLIDANDTDFPMTNPGIAIAPDALAYIYYTSGSTGKPKSAYNSQRNLLHHIRRNTNIFCVCPADRFLFLKSFSFAGAIKDIFSSLLNGASLHLYPLKQKGIVQLGDWLATHEITIYNSVATVFRQLVSTLSPTVRLPHLRLIYFGGESIKSSDVRAYQQHFAQHSMLVLGLGSTETGPVTALYLDGESQLGEGAVPLGYAAPETEVLILDADGKPLLTPHAEGEIAVQSRYLALGYWKNEPLTRQKFLPATSGMTTKPEDNGVSAPPTATDTRIYLTGDIGYLDEHNCLYHLGRQDFQVKIRGYRIELGEIEEALRKHPTIREVALVAKTLHGDEQGLVAYYVPTNDQVLTVTELRTFLTDRLPDYMIPALFVPLAALPVNHFGKLDLKALASLDRARPHLQTPYVAARTQVEEKLAAIWASLLEIDQVGVQDNFFDLGASSILAMQLLARIAYEFDSTLLLNEFAAAATIEATALAIQALDLQAESN